MKRPRVLASFLIGFLIIGSLLFARQSTYASSPKQEKPVSVIQPGTYSVETTYLTGRWHGRSEQGVYTIGSNGSLRVIFSKMGTGEGNLFPSVNHQILLAFREIIPGKGYIQVTQVVTGMTQSGFTCQGYSQLYTSNSPDPQQIVISRSVATRSRPATLPVTPSTTVTPVVTPTATPSPVSTNNGGTNTSGQAMPVGDLPGWHQIFAEDFKSSVPLGDFPGSVYGSKFRVYPDGTPDTAGQQGAPSRYEPSKVVSVSNGLLNLYLHTEGGTPMAAAILPTLTGNHLYGKYTIRFRSDALAGFKTAWLLWPDNGEWPQGGEIDFPEGGLAGSISAFVHHQGAVSGSDQNAYTTRATYTSWHTASIEWRPGSVTFLLDGKTTGTSTNRVPNTPMHWVIQTESCLDGCPSASTAGNLQIAWITAYSYTGA
jgi:hypothetical protein